MDEKDMVVDNIPNLAGVTDDDPNAPDEDEGLQTTEDFAKALGVKLPKRATAQAAEDAEDDEEPAEDEPDDEPDEEAEDDEPAAKPVEKPAPVDPDDEPRFTQKQLNTIMAQEKRITREAQAKMQQLELATGLKVEQLMEMHRKQAAQKLADEYGMVESEAKAIVETQEKARQLELELAELRAEQEAIKRQTTYQEQKAKYAANPNVKRYAAEIDQFAKEHSGWNYDVAVVAVLGQKAAEGKLQEDVATATRQQTISDVAKRKVGVQAARQSGAPMETTGMSAETRRLLDGMMPHVQGLTRKGVAKQAEQLKRQGRR